MAQSLHDIVASTDHAPPSHPLRALVDHHFYVDRWVSGEGGFSLLMLYALLFVPFAMFFMFFPVQALIGLGVALMAFFVVYEGLMLWRRHSRT